MTEPALRLDRHAADIVEEFRREPVGLGAEEHAVLLAGDGGLVGLAEPGGRFDQRLQHRLQVEGGAADDLQHVGRRGLLLQRLRQLRWVRACTSSNSRTFSMAITAWSAKVLTSSISLVGERPDGDALQRQHADQRVLAQERHSEDGAVVAHSPARPACAYSGSAAASGMCTILPSATARPTAEPRPGRERIGVDEFLQFGREAEGGDEAEIVAEAAGYSAHLGVAEPRRRCDQLVEHRLQVEGGAADDLQHLRRRRLLLQRLAQIAVARLHLVEQARRSRWRSPPGRRRC